MALECKECHFNFERLKVTLSMEELLKGNRVEGDQVRLYCPSCRTENSLELKSYGIFYLKEKEKLYRWRSATTTLTRGGYQIQLGDMILEIPEGKMEVISVQDICYRAVPVFRQVEGGLSLPRWPVKRGYFAFIDMTKDAKPEIVQDKYRIRLYLKGLERYEDVSLPLVPVQYGKSAQGENAVFGGVHLVLWPNVPYRDWKRYFLRFGCEGDSLKEAISPNRANVFAYASDQSSTRTNDWIPVNKVGSDKCTRYACVEIRPEWIAIEFEGKAEQEGGGIWAIEPAQVSYPQHMPTIAVDFGTSNTFIGWIDINIKGGEDRERSIPIESCEMFIIHGSHLPSVVDFADTWPPRQGFGKNKALLPSEILTREKLSELRLHTSDIKKWKPVEDYGIPSSGLDVRYPEAEHIIAEFKWKEMMPDEAFRPQAGELQKRYLEFLLLFVMAQLAMKKSIGNSVDVRFSYPLAFSTHEGGDLPEFRNVLTYVAASVSQHTGIKIGIDPQSLMDEARAAASSMGRLAADYSAFLYVDIGGGSTDIALALAGEQRREYAYIASFQYAGGGLVYALAEGACLKPDCDLNRFRRMIREVGEVKELMRMGTVFHPHKTNPINAKTFYFYSYLMEFIARLLAAHIITGEWAEGLTEEERKLAKQNGYCVAIYALGNGWGFGHFIDRSYAQDVFSEKLMDRANQILREAVEQAVIGQDAPQLVTKGQELKIADPKSAVAFGLLKESSQAAGTKKPWSYRTVLGWTTQVGRTRKVPWFLPITNQANPKKHERSLAAEQPLPSNPVLDCPKDEGPIFPQALPSPHLLDPDLNKTRRHLDACIPTAGKEWFVQSPFQVLLEKLFKPKLRELI